MPDYTLLRNRRTRRPVAYLSEPRCPKFASTVAAMADMEQCETKRVTIAGSDTRQELAAAMRDDSGWRPCYAEE